MLTYQPEGGTASPAGTVVVTVATPAESATVCWRANATPPGAAHVPTWMCEMWLELGARPVSLPETVNNPAALTISPVPDTALAFWAPIVKLILGAGGATAVPPPQAASATTLTRASNGLFIDCLYYVGPRALSP